MSYKICLTHVFRSTDLLPTILQSDVFRALLKDLSDLRRYESPPTFLRVTVCENALDSIVNFVEGLIGTLSAAELDLHDYVSSLERLCGRFHGGHYLEKLLRMALFFPRVAFAYFVRFGTGHNRVKEKETQKFSSCLASYISQ